MKLKVASIALIAAAALALTGCADNDGSPDDAATFAPTAVAGSVTVTLPASINNYAQVNTKQLTAAGVTDIKTGTDGSLVLTMPAAAATALAASTKTEILAEEARLQADPNQDISSFTNADDFSTIGVNTKMTQDAGGTGSAFNSLGVMAVEYQLFSGKTNPETKISILKADGTPNQTVTYPGALAG